MVASQMIKQSQQCIELSSVESITSTLPLYMLKAKEG
jgi:hypothetical protein